MAESINSTLSLPATTSRHVLTDILRDGAQRLLAQAVEAEVAEWIDAHAHLKNAGGHRQVVRNGHLPKRKITTGVGPIEVQQPRVLDRRAEGEAEPFSSKILPPYLRKTKSLEVLIP
jgi:putative transposase